MDYKMKRAASAKLGKKFAAALSAAVLVAPSVAQAVQPMVAFADTEIDQTVADTETYGDYTVTFDHDSDKSQVKRVVGVSGDALTVVKAKNGYTVVHNPGYTYFENKESWVDTIYDQPQYGRVAFYDSVITDAKKNATVTIDETPTLTLANFDEDALVGATKVAPNTDIESEIHTDAGKDYAFGGQEFNIKDVTPETGVTGSITNVNYVENATINNQQNVKALEITATVGEDEYIKVVVNGKEVVIDADENGKKLLECSKIDGDVTVQVAKKAANNLSVKFFTKGTDKTSTVEKTLVMNDAKTAWVDPNVSVQPIIDNAEAGKFLAGFATSAELAKSGEVEYFFNKDTNEINLPFDLKSKTSDNVVNLYAVWVDGVLLKYDANGGYGEMKQTTLVEKEDTSFIMPESSFKHASGKKQAGWLISYVTPDGEQVTDEEIAFGTDLFKYFESKDLTLWSVAEANNFTFVAKANWADEWSLVYSANDYAFNANAKAPTDEKVLSTGDVASLGYNGVPADANVKRFIGWNTKADGSGSYVDSHDDIAQAVTDGEITPSDDGKVTIYAIWTNTDSTGTISFDAKSDLPKGIAIDGAIASIEGIKADNYPGDVIEGLQRVYNKKNVNADHPKRYFLEDGIHKMFAGWTYGGQEIDMLSLKNPADPVAIPTDLRALVLNQTGTDKGIILKAKWVDTYSVRYNVKQGDDAGSSTLAYWLNKDGAKDKDWLPEGLLSIIPMSDSGADALKIYSAAAPMNPDKYDFTGWATEEGGVAKYTDSNLLIEAADADDQGVVDLYAVYTLKGVPYTVTFDGNGAEVGAMKDESFTTGEAKTLPACKFQKNNASFAGWKVYVDGVATDTIVSDEDVQTVLDSAIKQKGQTIKLSAQWNTHYLVRYVGGFDSDIQAEVTGTTKDTEAVQNEVGQLAECGFKREGYTFVGWALLKDGEPEVKFDSPYSKFVTSTKQLDEESLKGDPVLYAVWQKDTIAEPEVVSKDRLKSAIDSASKINPEDYTEESAKAFNDALKAAKDVYANDDATQAEVNYATDALKDAQYALEKKPAPTPTPTPKADGWNQLANDTWEYIKDGEPLKSTWVADGGNWFYMNANGIMHDGWLKDGDNWYFLSQEHDGSFGAMKTGWIMSDGLWYYMNPNVGGPKGAMMTGWQWINGKCYYLYEQTGGPKGACAINTVINGWKVDETGAWVQ